jgi:predicted O-methyltransferase YrrM
VRDLLQRIVTTAPRALRQPRKTARILRKRLFPLTAITRDPDAYQLVSNWTFGRVARVPLLQLFPGIEAMNVTILQAFDRKPDTSLAAQEIMAIAALVQLFKPRRILEIGTSDGNTALNLAANAPADATVTTIDLPAGWDGQLALKIPNTMVNVTQRSAVGRQFQGRTCAQKINQVFADSATVHWDGLPTPFDLALIDGCHHHAYVERDTANVMKHMKSGGVVLWHDYGIVEDVSRVVDREANRVPVSAILGTSLAVALLQ